jgi:hypothetical protein
MCPARPFPAAHCAAARAPTASPAGRDDLPVTDGRWLRVRLTTAVNRILQLPGASVHTVAFTDQDIVIG